MKNLTIEKISFALLGGLLLTACGEDVTKVTNVTNESSDLDLVLSADSLGPCDSGSIGKMLFASDENTAYVCLDLGWLPLSKNASCSVQMLSDSSGYKIMCDGDSVGVALNGKDGKDAKNGKDGKNGENGSNGTDGQDGESCSLIDNGDGTVTQICGKDSVLLTQALCGEKAYDPAKMECRNGRLFELMTDSRDGQVYRIVKIGNQTWMAENLNFAYPKLKDADGNETTDSISYCYDNDPANCEKYGRLYSWAAAMDSVGIFSEDGVGCGSVKTCTVSEPVRGVCPEGWHLSSHGEWNTLLKFVADSLYDGYLYPAGYALKATSGWKNNGNGSDAFGFEALPAGSGGGVDMLAGVRFWTSTEHSFLDAYDRALYYDGPALNINDDSAKSWDASVRCVKD